MIGRRALPRQRAVLLPIADDMVQHFDNGLLVAETRGYGTADEATWTYEHDPVTLGISAEIDPIGNTTHYTYDTSANVLTAEDPLGTVSSWTYDQWNNMTSQTVPNPSTVGPATVTSTFSYDGPGRMATSTQRLYSNATTYTEVTTTYVRDDPAHPGDVTRVIDPGGNEIEFELDPDTGYLLSTTDPTGAMTTFEYDDLGRQIAVISPHGHLPGADPEDWTTTSTFNEWGQPLVVTDPAGSTTVSSYDADGNVVSVIDALERETTFGYNKVGELTSVTRPDSSVLATTYWPDGQAATQYDSASEVLVSYDHDHQGRLVSASDALGRTSAMHYDDAGRMVALARPGGDCSTVPGTQCVRYGFDDAGRMVGVDYSEPSTPDVTFTYLASGLRGSRDCRARRGHLSWLADRHDHGLGCRGVRLHL